MRSKILQAQAREKRREILEHEQKLENLNEICSTILLNQAELEVEISKISNFLSSVEDVVVKYSEQNQNMVYWHAKQLFKEFDNIVFLKILSKQLEKIGENAILEFFGGINFFDFIEELSSQEYKLNKVLFVWKAQKAIKNISYQFNRIWNCDDKKYQVAVLKGMIAMY